MSCECNELKTKAFLENAFEEWWAKTHSHLDPTSNSAMVNNLCGMIKVISKEAYLSASEPYVDTDALKKS